jgi:hypothetical protein
MVAFSPGPEYPRLSDIMASHYVDSVPKKNVSFSDVLCVSPFDNITNFLSWMTSIRHLPISTLQALSFVSRGGSCDPWIEDSKLCAPHRVSRFSRSIYELLELFKIDDVAEDDSIVSVRKQFRGVLTDSDGSSIPSKISYPADLDSTLRSFDVGGGGKHAELPFELLRNYMQAEDTDLSNSQLTTILWSLNRTKADSEFYEAAVRALKAAEMKDNEGTADEPAKEATEDVEATFKRFKKTELKTDVRYVSMHSLNN